MLTNIFTYFLIFVFILSMIVFFGAIIVEVIYETILNVKMKKIEKKMGDNILFDEYMNYSSQLRKLEEKEENFMHVALNVIFISAIVANIVNVIVHFMKLSI